MNFIDVVKTFFKRPKVDPATVAARDAISVSSDAYSTAFSAIKTYTNCANHRSAILQAKSTLSKAPPDDCNAAYAYDKAVAAYTDPADFEPYTEAYLDAHTSAIDTLSAAFSNFTAAFDALNPADDVYASSADLHKAICNSYKFAAEAYSTAAESVMITALKGSLQAAKDKFEVMLLETEAKCADKSNLSAAKAKASAFKDKALEDATKAKVLEEKARVAETKAKTLLVQVVMDEMKAEIALESVINKTVNDT